MNQRLVQLKNLLKKLNLSDSDLNKVEQWYKEIHTNEIVFPKELSVSKQMGVSTSQKILVLMALRKFFKPVTVPKLSSQLLKTYASDGYELTLNDEIIDEARSRGINPSQITAVTGFKKCIAR